MTDKLASNLIKEFKYDNWMRSIEERNQEINQAMEFLKAIIKDWSSRAWVISEYHIAKEKNSHKMKFWFLSFDYCSDLVKDQGFFQFDFVDGTIKNTLTQIYEDNLLMREVLLAFDSFQHTMEVQLNQQSFLEKMLKSKASRNGTVKKKDV
jgi:hypothetical protein